MSPKPRRENIRHKGARRTISLHLHVRYLFNECNCASLTDWLTSQWSRAPDVCMHGDIMTRNTWFDLIWFLLIIYYLCRFILTPLLDLSRQTKHCYLMVWFVQTRTRLLTRPPEPNCRKMNRTSPVCCRRTCEPSHQLFWTTGSEHAKEKSMTAGDRTPNTQ